MEQFKFLKGKFTNEKVIPPISGAIAAAYSDGEKCSLDIDNSEAFQNAILNNDDSTKQIYVITPEQLTPTIEIHPGTNALSVRSFSSISRSGDQLPPEVAGFFNDVTEYSNVKIAPIGKINWNIEVSTEKVPTDMLLSVNGEHTFKKAEYTVSGQLKYDRYEILNGDASTITNISQYKLSSNLNGALFDFDSKDGSWYENGVRYYKAQPIKPTITKTEDISQIIKNNDVADNVDSISFTVTPRVNEESTLNDVEYFVKLNDGAIPIIDDEATAGKSISINLFTRVGQLNLLYIFQRTGDTYALNRIIPFQKDLNKCYKKDGGGYAYVPDNAYFVSNNDGQNQLEKASIDNAGTNDLYAVNEAKFFDNSNIPYITDYKPGDDLYCKQIESVSEDISESNVEFDSVGNILPKNYTRTINSDNNTTYFDIYKEMPLNKTCTVS